MSPIKFEEKIKEELESRTIAVSDAAWKKLENRLEISKKKKGKSFWWIGIAASILISGWVAVEVLQTKEISAPIIVVDSKVKEIIPDGISESEEQLQILSNEEVKKENEQPTEVNYPKIERFESKPILVQVNAAPNEVIKISHFEDQKVDEIVAHILKSTKPENEISDREIEDLILKAQKEIHTQQMINKSAKTVSAESLLFEVEIENDKSFRDKVFDELKIQFKSMKNAVAQREN